MKKDTQPRSGVSKSNAPASATAATMRTQQQPQAAAERKLDAAAPAGSTPAVSISARYIDSRLKQFCLR